MSVSDAVPRKFRDDFELVAHHYRLRELGEYELAKQAARDDLETAIVTFARLAVGAKTDRMETPSMKGEFK
jgi:hypothetical protein